MLSRRYGLMVIAGWIILLGYLCINALSRIPEHMGDFGHFYYAAQAMTQGEDIYASWHRGYIYPPFLAFLYEPFALLPEHVAAAVLVFCNALLLLAAALLGTTELSRRFRLSAEVAASEYAPKLAGMALLAALLTEDKLRGELQMWQTNSLMLFLFTLALWLLDRRPALAGIALGAAFSIKYLPIVTLPYLLARRRFTTAGAFVTAAVGFAFLPAVRTGWDTNLANLTVAYGGLLRMIGLADNSAVVAQVEPIDSAISVSVTSAFARVLPVSAAFAVAGALAIGLLILASWYYQRLGIAFWYRPDGARPHHGGRMIHAVVGLEWVGLLVGVLAFSPQTNTRHMSMLLLANVATVVLLLQHRRPGFVSPPRWPLILGAVVLAAALTFPPGGQAVAWLDDPWHHAGGPAWGALVLCAALFWFGLRCCMRSSPMTYRVFLSKVQFETTASASPEPSHPGISETTGQSGIPVPRASLAGKRTA